MLTVTIHGKHRMHQRCGIKSKAVDRISRIAFENGLSRADVSGPLGRYLDYLYFYNCEADNIRLYGDKVYVFCKDVLVTVLDTPRKYRPIVNKLMDKRRYAIAAE